MNKNTEQFKWDDKLAMELCEYVGMRVGKDKDIRQQVELLTEDFKQSKSKTEQPLWEILSYINPNVVTDVVGGNIVYAKGSGAIYAILKNFPIHSVKRLSDGEVFSVGDVLQIEDGKNGKKPILSFELRYDGTQMWCTTDAKERYGCCLSVAEKAPKEEQVPIKVSHITSHDAINFRDKTVYSHAVWVSQPIPESKYQPIREAIEDILNYEKCWVFPLIPKMGYRIELDALDIDFIKDQPQSLKEIIKMLKDKVVKSQRWYLAAMVRDLEKLVDNANKYNDKKYTESELLQARRDAFDAAREVVGYSDALKNSPVTVGRKYKDNEDYINSLNK